MPELSLKAELQSIVSALHDSGIPYALCGGLAVVVHGYPRATKDIDLLILEKDLDAVKAALQPLGYTLESGIIPFQVGTDREHRLFRISRVIGTELLTLDLLLVGSYLQDVWDDREEFAFDKTTLSVVSRKGLAKMKRNAGRHQDLADLENLGLPLEDEHES